MANFHGMLFGTFQPEKAEPLEQYLGEFGTGMIERFMHKPVRVLGYSRQMVTGTGSCTRRTCATPITRACCTSSSSTYGVDRATQRGGVKMDARHRHNMNHAYAATDTQEDARAAYAGTAGVALDRMRLRDPSF